MKVWPIFVVLAVGATLGWLSPDASDSAGAFSAQGEEAQPGQNQNRLDVVQQEPWSPDVVLQRAPDAHFYADVTVDGATSEMLADTGASVIALTGEDAAAMGIHWDDADVRPVARGASGPVYGVQITLNNVQLGGFEASGVRAMVVPEGLGISLLGQSFLSRIGKVEIDREKMVLGG